MTQHRSIRGYVILAMVLLITLCGQQAKAQHTLSISAGSGISTARFYPSEETKWLWGSETLALSWRFYSPKPRFVGAVGIDLEYLQRGYCMGYTYTVEFVDDHEIRHYKYYTRNINSIMLPLVWQPHFYLAKNRLRLFVEAAFVLSYNLSSDYSYEEDRYPPGNYEWKVPRDNRFGYGLSGGVGLSVLLGQLEVGIKGRYIFGYSDVIKNRNKYYSGNLDGNENPFYYTPLRSPLDNINVMLTVGWRFNKRGFDEWFVVRKKKDPKLKTFNFSEQTGGSSSSSSRRR